MSISVVIPAFNAERYLAEAITSVSQPGVDEIIVVDDGSSDRSAAIAQTFPLVRVISQPNQGIAAARNRGLAEARGETLAFVDADDRWDPNKLAVQVPLLDANPDALVLGMVEEFVSPELDDAQKARLTPKPGRLAGWLVGAMLIRRATFDRIGPFEDLAVGEAIAWFAKAKTLGIPSIVPDALVMQRRLHGENFTFKRPGIRAEYLALAKKMLDRRRS